jgi:hypothetical protein
MTVDRWNKATGLRALPERCVDELAAPGRPPHR